MIQGLGPPRLHGPRAASRDRYEPADSQTLQQRREGRASDKSLNQIAALLADDPRAESARKLQSHVNDFRAVQLYRASTYGEPLHAVLKHHEVTERSRPWPSAPRARWARPGARWSSAGCGCAGASRSGSSPPGSGPGWATARRSRSPR